MTCWNNIDVLMSRSVSDITETFFSLEEFLLENQFLKISEG